jgi:hypothetical protein
MILDDHVGSRYPCGFEQQSNHVRAMVKNVNERDYVERRIAERKRVPIEDGHGNLRVRPRMNINPFDPDVGPYLHAHPGNCAVSGSNVQNACIRWNNLLHGLT